MARRNRRGHGSVLSPDSEGHTRTQRGMQTFAKADGDTSHCGAQRGRRCAIAQQSYDLELAHVSSPLAQCASLAREGAVYAAGSEDMDTLTFGGSILYRHLTFSEAKKAPIMEVNLQRALEGLEMDMGMASFSVAVSEPVLTPMCSSSTCAFSLVATT